jgi:hypothetical protein
MLLRTTSFLVLFLLLLFGGRFAAARSQPAEQRPPEHVYIPVDPALGQYDGARSCQQCHTAPLPVEGSTDYVKLTEYKIWSEQDKHSNAFNVLANERSKRMGKALGYEPSKAWQCLNCHAMNVPPAVRAPSFTIESGVSCDACHGPSEKWDREHRFPAWRTKPMAEKAKLGFYDVREPLSRARLCTSCHVGDQRLGRFITHEMYAAGHPPMPGFELATFCNQMPPHWRKHIERKPEVQAALQQAGLIDPEQLAETKALLVGGMVSLAASLRLADEQARSQRPWPEFAQYDCFACHHDLSKSSWRQRGDWAAPAGAPGRPMPRRWPETLAAVGLELLGEPPDTLRGELRPLHDAFSIQPFGRRELVQQHAGPTVIWAEQHAERLSKLKIGKAEAMRVLRTLVQRGANEPLDYDPARQLAWAVKVIHGECGPTNDGSTAAMLIELEKVLRLRLHDTGQRQIEQDLATRLHLVYEFEPAVVRKLFHRLASGGR